MKDSKYRLSLVMKLTLLTLILAISIPLRYESTNPLHLLVRLSHSLVSIKHSLVPDRSRPTLSADYCAFEDLLRATLKPLRTPNLIADPLEATKGLRASFVLGTIIPKPARCQLQRQLYMYDGHLVETYWINHHQNEKLNTDHILIYFHGGGYLAGSIHTHSGFECHLSRLFNISILHLEYRLAPEHPLSAAVDDALTLYHALLYDGISPSRISLMGDSAGGGLALLTVQALLTHRLPIPHAVVVMSPWTDFSSSGKSYKRNRFNDLMFSDESLMWGIEQVLGLNNTQKAREDPLYSPLFGSFDGFPHLYITVGTAEVLEDDARQVAEKARRAQVNVTLHTGQHMMHTYPIFLHYYPEAREALDNISIWLKARLQ